MPEPFAIPNELAQYWNKPVQRIDRPRNWRIEPNATVNGVVHYTTDGGAAHGIGWHVQIKTYDDHQLCIPLEQFLAEWQVVK